MTIATDVSPVSTPLSTTANGRDPRGSWIPSPAMIATRCMELRKRRGLMVAIVVVTIGIPTVFLAIRLLLHAFDPHSYGPAGGYAIYNALIAGVLYVFGFIVAATLGATAGSIDLSEGMFRHLVVTGRSRLALYLARIPAGLAIVVPLVAIGFIVVCTVCVFAAPAQVSYDGATVPGGLTRVGLESWASEHPAQVLCNFPYNSAEPMNVQCGPGGPGPATFNNGVPVFSAPGAADRSLAIQIARQDYSDYRTVFLYPSTSLMIRTGLWIELEVIVGFIVGLGLGSLLGQRTVAMILLIILEVILTPLLSRAKIPHMIDLQRSVVGLAVAHLEPAGLGFVFGGGGGPGGESGTSLLAPESHTVAVLVIIAWLVGWSALGAWRMMTRDA
jgi:hypothetical protein